LTAAENRLIELLPPRDRERLLASCEPFALRLGDVIYEPGLVTTHAYFPVESFISLVTVIDGSPGLEVGMVGREGMLGCNLALDVATTPFRALVQGTGLARRIGMKAFRAELARSAVLQRTVGRYVHVLMAQIADSSACLHYHQISPRLARWLLMSQDRAHASAFHVTHEFLALMLGVRRVGVTTAAVALQRAGLIDYRRGEMSVLDRAGLVEVACGCYRAQQGNYETLLGHAPVAVP
jgi:CRP-like cAMP-binding protein